MNLLVIKEKNLPEYLLTGKKASHLINEVGIQKGSVIRIAELNGRIGEGTILDITSKGILISCKYNDTTPIRGKTSLILAMPRPKVLKYLFPQFAMMGVDKVYLVNAARVPKDYFGTHWILPEHYTPLLIEGLEQGITPHLPEVYVIRRLREFIEKKISLIESAKVLFDPNGEPLVLNRNRLCNSDVIIALGPELGWQDYEKEMFVQAGFSVSRIGEFHLRTDTACIACIALSRFL